MVWFFDSTFFYILYKGGGEMSWHGQLNSFFQEICVKKRSPP